MKNIIVSGSSSGIGRGITERLLGLDYHVIGLARDHSKFMPDNQHYNPVNIDFANMKQLEPALKALQQQCDVSYDTIDALILCAGYGRFSALEQFSAQQIQDLMNVNFTSQVILVKTFLSGLKQRKQGKIIVLGSESSLQGAKKASIYCASKFALRGFCQSLRQECRQSGVSVSLINPGLVQTPFFDALDFTPGKLPQNALSVADVVEAIMLVITAKPNCVLEEINVQPLLSQVELRGQA